MANCGAATSRARRPVLRGRETGRTGVAWRQNDVPPFLSGNYSASIYLLACRGARSFRRMLVRPSIRDVARGPVRERGRSAAGAPTSTSF